MAEQELKIRLEIEGKGADATAAELKRIVNEVKLLDIQMRQGAKSSQDVERATKNLELQLQKAFSTGKISAEQYRKTLVSVFGVSEHAETRFISMSRSIHGMEKNVHAGTTALFSFGNIIQDSSQFSMGFGQGIRAIGNNITQMTQQMVYMVAATGSTAVAFRTLWVSMMGPAGILLAISAITTAITLFANQQKETKKQTDEARKAIDAQRKAIEDTTKAIDNYNKRFIGGTTEGRIQATQFDLQMMEARRRATEEMIIFMERGGKPGEFQVGLFPGVMQGFTKEQTLAYLDQIRVLKEWKSANVETFRVVREEWEKNIGAARAARMETGIRGPRPTRFTQEMPMADVDEEIRLAFMMAGMGGMEKRGARNRIEEDIDRQLEEDFRKKFEPIGRSFKKMFADSFEEFGGFKTAFMSGIDAMGGAVSQGLGNAFAKTFNGINSLFEIMVVRFAQAITEMVIRAAALAWLRTLPGVGPLFESGSTLTPAPGGKEGRVYVPQDSPYGLKKAGGGDAGKFVVRGADLVYVVDRSRQRMKRYAQ